MVRPRTAAVASILLIPMVAGGFLIQAAPPRATPKLFEQVLSVVANRYVDSLSASDVYEKASRGLVRELNDPYSELFAPRQSEEFNRSTGGRYGGVGMLLEEQKLGGGTSIIVRTVFPHTPAEEGGVQEGDRIARVDSLAVSGDVKIDRVSDALRGVPGTSVQVVFARPGVSEPVKLSFRRAVVHVPAVPYATMLGDQVGYIPLQTFNENAAEEVEAAAQRLVRAGARGLVLDLRDNGGGIVDQSLAVSSLFLKPGQAIVGVRSRSTADEVVRASSEQLASQPPLVVLTDGGSASASEIVAGALQDHDRALVLGTTSFGKGLVQSLFPLDGGYALKITTGKWYTPSGRSIHRERKLVDGRLVEARPDSLETEAEKRSRPKYSSDAGRTVYGGGGITPDVIVPDDTLSTPEQEFLRSVAPKAQAFVTVLNQYAFELKSTAGRDFTVTPAWRAELRRRLAAAGVTIDPKLEPAATKVLDNQLDRRVARHVLGDAGAKARGLADDHQLSRALQLLKVARTQDALFAAGRAAAASPATARR